MVVCGPPPALTLAATAEVRVYVQHGHAFGCARNGRTRDLGPRRRVVAVKASAFRAAVRRRLPRRREELAVYSLRTRRLLSNHRTRGRVGAFAIDRNGVLLYTEAPDGDKPFVGSNRTFGLVPDGLFPDFLHYASATVAWRDPYGIHTWQVRGGSKEAGTLYRSGDVRVVASNLELYLRAPGLDKRIGYPFLDCPGSGGCDGIDTIQVAGRYAGVEWAGFDRYDSFGTLTIYDTATGKRSYPCGASHKTDDRVETFVLTPQGKVACVRVVNQIPRVVSDGVVLDEGKGIDEDSLARRGDQIVWRHDGLQRTAPLPTASG